MPPSYRGQSIQSFPYANLLQEPVYTITSLCHPPTGASLYTYFPMPPSYRGQSIQLFLYATLLQGQSIQSIFPYATHLQEPAYTIISLCHPPTGASLYNNYTMTPSYRCQSIQLFPYATLLQESVYTIISLCHPPTGASINKYFPMPPSYRCQSIQ